MLARPLGPTYVDPFDRVCLGLRLAFAFPQPQTWEELASV